jgi:hypothetical protein
MPIARFELLPLADGAKSGASGMCRFKVVSIVGIKTGPKEVAQVASYESVTPKNRSVQIRHDNAERSIPHYMNM